MTDELKTAIETAVANHPAPAGTFVIHGEPFYAPTTAQFLSVLDDTSTPPEKKIFPPLVFADFDPVEDGVRHIVRHQGRYQNRTPKTFGTILEHSGFVPDADKLAGARTTGAAIDEIHADTNNNWTVAAADQRYHGQARELANRNPAGKLDDILLRARDEVRYDFKKKRDANELRIQPLSQQARDAVKPIIEAALNCVRISMVVMEESERQHAEDFGLDWIPSALWRAHASILVNIRPEFVQREIHPRAMLALIGITL